MTISRSQMERQLRMGGGIMNIENRQKYLFGGITKSIKKAVKGATNAAKKFAKSDLGKAALLYAGGAGLGALGAGSAGTGFGLKMFGPKAFASNLGMSLGKLGLGSKFIGPSKPGLFGLTGSQAALGIGAASTLAGILASDAEMTEEEAEELKQDPAALRNYLRLYYSNLNPNASKQEVDSFVRTNMYADGGRVNYQQGSQPAPAPAQPGSLQGATSLYGDVIEYLKRQGRQSDQPRMISPDEISGPMPATPYPFSGAGSFLGGGAINTPTPPTVGGPGTGMLQPPSPPSPTPTPPNNVPSAPTTPAPIVKKQPIIDFSPYLSMENINVKVDPLGRKTINETDSKKLSEGITAISQLLQKKYTDDMYGKNKGKKRNEAFASYFGEYDPDSIYWAQYGRGKNAEVQSDEDFGTYIDPQTREITKFNQGGRVEYAMGSPEQNAMQAAGIMDLPLNQNKAGVTELDLRKSGGFIPPVGVKEKADDIPAMLSNNEFVFTADAVRGMGNGNVNKGAQRMYDMMKKLEKGGRV